MQKFTCLHCKVEKPADDFVKNSKNPTMCLECRRKRMRERKMKKHDTNLQHRKTVSFSPFGLGMIAAFQQGGSASEACQRIFQHAYDSLDSEMKKIVDFYVRELQIKSSNTPHKSSKNVNMSE